MQSAQFQLHAAIEERHWWFVARRQIVRQLIERVVRPAAGATIVDVGCGTGANLGELAADYRCLGIDTSAEAIELARARFPDVRFVAGTAPRDVAAEMARAGVVLLMDVLEHVADDFGLFAELLAATEPGTTFVVTVPAERALWTVHDEAFGHYRRYEPARLAQVWQQLPTTTLLLSPFNARLYPVVRTVRWLNRLRGNSSGEAGTDFRIPPATANRALTRLFAAEAERLVAVAEGRSRTYARGVSLVALVRREAGPVPAATRPVAVLPDLYDPVAGTYFLPAGGSPLVSLD